MIMICLILTLLFGNDNSSFFQGCVDLSFLEVSNGSPVDVVDSIRETHRDRNPKFCPPLPNTHLKRLRHYLEPWSRSEERQI